MSEKEGRTFTPQDFRFTSKPGILYAICLAAPAPAATLNIRSLATGQPVVKSVKLLGCRESLPWSCDAGGLHAQVPAALRCAHALTLRIGIIA
jgi:alpha-L-fucosidase